MLQRYRTPIGVLIGALVGVVVLLTVDILVLLENPARFRADLRLLLGLIITGTITWLALRIARTWFDQVERRLERIERGASEPPTIRLGRVVAVARAAAQATTPPPRIDPDVIDIARRLEGKVTRGLDQ